MRKRKPKIGSRDICKRCDLEIEYWGRNRRGYLGGWIDRGGNRFCPRRIVAEEYGTTADLLHEPLNYDAPSKKIWR